MQVSPHIYSSILQCKCRNVKKITPQQKFDLHEETSKEMLFLNTVEAQGYAKVNKYGDIHLLLYFSVFSFHVIVIKIFNICCCFDAFLFGKGVLEHQDPSLIKTSNLCQCNQKDWGSTRQIHFKWEGKQYFCYDIDALASWKTFRSQ